MWVIFLVAWIVPPSLVDHSPKLIAIGDWPKNGLLSGQTTTFWKTEVIQSYLRICGTCDPISFCAYSKGREWSKFDYKWLIPTMLNKNGIQIKNWELFTCKLFFFSIAQIWSSGCMFWMSNDVKSVGVHCIRHQYSEERTGGGRQRCKNANCINS